MTQIYIAEEANQELFEAMQRLVPQLSTSNPPPSREALQEIVASDASFLLMARADTGIVGSLTLILFRIPTGIRAWIEDVIVDEVARDRGVGGALIKAAIDHAFTAGAITVDLTSRPSREAANRLYINLGFQQRNTNVYRYARPEQFTS